MLLASCAQRPYRQVTWAPAPPGTSALALKPVPARDLYRCTVDGRFLWKKFHLSGVLLIKKMDDGHTRAVFSNEMGFSFFDFEWNERDSFWVNQVIPQLDKPAVVKTLKKDFNVLLMKGLDASAEQVHQFRPDSNVCRFPLEKGHVVYALSGFERPFLTGAEVIGRSRVTTMVMSPARQQLPDTISIRHHKARFTIDLVKIREHVEE